MYIKDFKTGFRFIFRHKVFTMLRMVSLIPGMTGMTAYLIYHSSPLSGTGEGLLIWKNYMWDNLLALALMYSVSCIAYGLICYFGRKLKFTRILVLMIYGGSPKDIFFNVLAETLIVVVFSSLISIVLIDQWMVIFHPLTDVEKWFRGITIVKFLIMPLVFFAVYGMAISCLYSKINVGDLIKN